MRRAELVTGRCEVMVFDGLNQEDMRSFAGKGLLRTAMTDGPVQFSRPRLLMPSDGNVLIEIRPGWALSRHQETGFLTGHDPGNLAGGFAREHGRMYQRLEGTAELELYDGTPSSAREIRSRLGRLALITADSALLVSGGDQWKMVQPGWLAGTCSLFTAAYTISGRAANRMLEFSD